MDVGDMDGTGLLEMVLDVIANAFSRLETPDAPGVEVTRLALDRWEETYPGAAAALRERKRAR